MLVYRAYVFNLQSKNRNSVALKCSTRKCKAYIIIKHGIEVFCSNGHTHPNNELKIVKLYLLGKLREKAKQRSRDYNKKKFSLNEKNQSKIPNYSYLNDAIKKERNKCDLFIPHMKQEILLVLQRKFQDRPLYRLCDIASKEKVFVFYSDFSRVLPHKHAIFNRWYF
jgi:hypothetical protein